MTQKQCNFLITPSLLNSWGYIWDCEKYVKSNENDEICLEDKISLAREKAFNDFVKVLNRIPTETNEAMLKGIQYEQDCYDGKTEISGIIKGGSYQIVGKKEMTINGIDFLLYGRLDVLKGGVIYDIKKVRDYAPQKYLNSYQHPFYLELFENAYKFEYLVSDMKDVIHIETYYRDEVVDIKDVISNFIKWLKKNNLLKTYLEKWRAK